MFTALRVLSPFIIGAVVYRLASAVPAFADSRAAGCKGCTDTSCPGYDPWL